MISRRSMFCGVGAALIPGVAESSVESTPVQNKITKIIVAKHDADTNSIVKMATIEDVVSKVLIVKVGDQDRPAQPEDIQDIVKCLTELVNKDQPHHTLVTHHLVQFEEFIL